MILSRCVSNLLRLHKNLPESTFLVTMSNNVRADISLIKDFSDFKFSPSKLLELPIEANRDNYVRRYIKGVIFSHVQPSPLSNPKLVAFSDTALTDILGLDPVVGESEDFIDFVAGNNVLSSSTPIAHRYGGHQFGIWAMQLGDGRAIILGEHVNRKGERWELQLKGSGKTPYSRDGDGRAVLRSSIREFLCSEAMFYLGIPTSRAAALIVSEDKVIRDMFYDGHPKLESTAVVLRLAQSWFRIGSLELLTKSNEIDLLRDLINFIVKEHFPDIPDDADKIVNFVKKVIRSSIDLGLKWMSVGFTHGVLNTDNISLLGITIDYGPFGFMENYDYFYVPNHSDSQARYCYGRQMQVILFNLVMLVKALVPLMTEEQRIAIAEVLVEEDKCAGNKFKETLSHKLGFRKMDVDIVNMMIDLFEKTKADFTMTYREMSENTLSSLKNPHPKLWALGKLSKHSGYMEFIESYSEKIIQEGISEEERMEKMCKLNPRYILRNWMAEQAIRKAENGDYSEVNLLLKILKNPFTIQEEAEKMGYASKPPEWAEGICLSCSS